MAAKVLLDERTATRINMERGGTEYMAHPKKPMRKKVPHKIGRVLRKTLN
jgi:hypothetical protein